MHVSDASIAPPVCVVTCIESLLYCREHSPRNFVSTDSRTLVFYPGALCVCVTVFFSPLILRNLPVFLTHCYLFLKSVFMNK